MTASNSLDASVFLLGSAISFSCSIVRALKTEVELVRGTSERITAALALSSAFGLPIIHLSLFRYSEDERTSRCWCQQIVTSYALSI
jgi:hypothetical protein